MILVLLEEEEEVMNDRNDVTRMQQYRRRTKTRATVEVEMAGERACAWRSESFSQGGGGARRRRRRGRTSSTFSAKPYVYITASTNQL